MSFNLSKTCALYSQPYLDTCNQCYKNIVTINLPPKGPLFKFIRKIKTPPLSPFKEPGPCNPLQTCSLALTSVNMNYSQCSGLMVVDEVPDLISFLTMNNYTIDTSLTKMMNTSDIRFQTNNANKLIFFITYNG